MKQQAYEQTYKPIDQQTRLITIPHYLLSEVTLFEYKISFFTNKAAFNHRLFRILKSEAAL